MLCMSLCVVFELCDVLGSHGAGDMWPAQDGQGEPDWVRLCVVCLCVVYELCNVLDSRGAGDMWPAQDGQEEPDWVCLCVVYESVCCV